MLTVSMILGTVCNSMYTIACSFFVIPRKKIPWWQSALALILILTGYYFLAEESKSGNIALAASIELCELVLPVVLLCTGDPWRNILIRLIFQMIGLVFFYVEFGLYELFLHNIVHEKWMDGLADLSLGAQFVNVGFTAIKVYLSCVIARYIVKRWKPEHKKIYTWITLTYLICGMISGVMKINDYTKGGYSFEYAVMLLIIPSILLAILVSAIYTRTEKERLRKEIAWYEERIKGIQDHLSETTSVQECIDKQVAMLEDEQVHVNCFELISVKKLSSDMELLIDRLFAWIRSKQPESANLSFRNDGDMLLVNVSLAGASDMPAQEEREDIERLSKLLDGTAIVDTDEISIMAFDVDSKENA